MDQTKKQFTELLVSVGDLIIKSPTVIAFMEVLARVFESAGKSIAKWAEGRDIIGELAKILVVVGGYVNTYLVAPLEFGFNLLKTGAYTIATEFAGWITIFALVGAGLNDYIIKPVVDFVGGALGKLVSLVDKDLGASIDNFVQTSTSAITTGLQSVADQAGAITSSMAEKTAGAANNVFDFSVAANVQSYLEKLDTFVDNVAEPTKAKFQEISNAVNPGGVSLWGSFADNFMAAQRRVAGTAEAMNQTMRTLGTQVAGTFNQGFTTAFSAMGAALVHGENMFAAFGKAMIGTLGDVAIQFGATYIALGVARIFASYGADPSGWGLLTAGAALAAAGGVLKAIGGSGSGAGAAGAASAGSGGGGVAAGGGSGIAPTQAPVTSFNDTQRKDVGTNVQVVVQGNVFDRRETGMHIADVINETFGSNGLTFATGKA